MAREWDPAEEGIKAARRDNAMAPESAQIIGRLIKYRCKKAKVVAGAYGYERITAYWVLLLEDCGNEGDKGDEIIVSRKLIEMQLGMV